MEAMFMVLLIAVLVEAIVQAIKAGVPEGAAVPAWLWPAVSAGLGVLLCVLAGVDAFAVLGVGLSIPAVGCVLTGVLVSRGASFVHDIWHRINTITEITLPVEVPVDVQIDGLGGGEKPPDGEGVDGVSL